MKHMKWLALLTAIMMVLGMGAAMGDGYTRGTLYSSSQGSVAQWLQVPWEDKDIDVWFGILSCNNETDALLNHGEIFIDILSKNDDAWQARRAALDASSIDEDTLMLLDIYIVNQDGEQVTVDTNAGYLTKLYVQITNPWEEKTADLNFAYAPEGGDKLFGKTLVTDPAPRKDAAGQYMEVNMDHFSPFAAYVNIPVAAPVAPPSGSVPSTGDQSTPAMWLALAAMSAAAVIGFGRKARKA